MSRRLALVLFLARLIRKPLPIFTKSRLPVITANRLPPICSYIVFAIIFRCSLGVMFGRCGHRPNAQNTVFSAMCVSFQPHFHALYVVLARYDCRMGVNGGKPTALIVLYPPFEGINSPRFGIVKDAVQFRDRLVEFDYQRLIGCAHCLPSFPSFAVSHFSLAVRHSSNVGLTQENSSPSVWR